MLSSKTKRLLACLLVFHAGYLRADEAEVPLFSKEEALKLVSEPISRMVDETTCERIEATGYADRLMEAGTKSALFRMNKPSAPFMRVATREDGVFVARFPAYPNEVIVARSYIVDRRSGRYAYGQPLEATCVSGKVEVGDVLPVKEEFESGYSDKP